MSISQFITASWQACCFWLAQCLHLSLCVFLCTGYLFPHTWILYLHLASCVLIPLHWLTNQGRCILTVWTQQCKHSTPHNSHTPFIKQLLQLLHTHCHLPLPSDHSLRILVFSAPIIAACISLSKLADWL